MRSEFSTKRRLSLASYLVYLALQPASLSGFFTRIL